MRIVVTAQHPEMDAPVDPHFGRAHYLLVVDTETGEHTAVSNAINLNSPQGAGIQTGKRVVDLGGKVVISGHVGPKAFSTLMAGGVAVYTTPSGTVSEAVARFKSGSLKQALSPDVSGHQA
ncbi:MAG TPA: NifB/NifX family molybdenum-iron cluster-binding protein [Phycisphaerae bacterium]|nr:NifB/NifX family molybdenum-iron cluster-binding protein [Phycisphaerae bacterium]HRY69795.1 NifB/NifX family molybdenum-iron cluster-binding protein [Phycisphaerae bacterium]HSA25372.1 NifB/NifX family molybdenum-iron cluster-binding protein [Phycisphaerae bacterium]